MTAEALRHAAQLMRQDVDTRWGAVAEFLGYEAERFFNADDAEPQFRYIDIPPRERRLAIGVVHAYLSGENA